MKAREHGAFRTLPEVYFWLIPELDELDWPDESRADCSDCVMIARPDESPPRPRTFNPKVRCCTYHPSLTNFLAGGLLRDGGDGAERVRRRLADPDGVDPDGLNPQSRRSQGDMFGQAREFGKGERYLCPFYVGGDLACGIWPHRTSVCRTWFCLHRNGYRGGELWGATRNMLGWVERSLGLWCVEQGSPPAGGNDPAAFEAWYVWCAERIERATPDEVAHLADEELDSRRAQVRRWYERLHEPIADVLEPAVGHFVKHDDGVVLYGDAFWDSLAVPGSIFELLSRLDGETPWREALAEAQAAAEDSLDESLVLVLERAGALMPPDAAERALATRKETSLEVDGKLSNPVVSLRWIPVEDPGAKPKGHS